MKGLREYRELNKIVDTIFKESDRQGLSWDGLANAAGLASSTVWNLGNATTMFPRVQTIFLLAKAVGMELTLIAGRRAIRKAG